MKKYLLLFIILFTYSSNGFAQKSAKDLEKAYKMYDEYKYAEAIVLLKPFADDTVKVNRTALRKLADCYRKINDFSNAEVYLAKVVAIPNITSKYFLYYGQVLHTNGKSDEALGWIKKYIETNPQDVQAKDLLNSISSTNVSLPTNQSKNETLTNENKPGNKPPKYIKPIIPYAFTNLEKINTPASEYGAILFEDGIYYCSTQIDKLLQKTDKWTNSGFLNMYYAKKKSDSIGYTYEGKDRLKGVVNGMSFNTGPACLSNDYNTLFYTRNNTIAGDGQTNKKDEVVLKIFNAKRNGDLGWSDEKVLEFNSENSSAAYPSISPNGKVMYFTSNRNGGMGGVDIFYCNLLPNGKWGKIENAGKIVNTLGNERFPFIHADGSLYFSSDGQSKSLGGMDIYRALADTTGKFYKIEHLGAPYNSDADDFSFYLNALETQGFIASNRSGGIGSDDIYCIQAPVTNVVLHLEGDTVLSTLPSNSIYITPAYAHQIMYLNFEKNNCKIEALPNTTYIINGEIKGVKVMEQSFTTGAIDTETEVFVKIQKNKPTDINPSEIKAASK
jgi:tetratricopeptide (TPR) repeat protein